MSAGSGIAAGGLIACGLGDPRKCRHHVVLRSEARPAVSLIETAWIESPVIYPRSKVPPNDIVKLARDAGRWAGIYEVHAVQVNFIEPATWKGQVPKEIHHKRIRASLNGYEKEILAAALEGISPGKQHNVLDAVGIGLWARGR